MHCITAINQLKISQLINQPINIFTYFTLLKQILLINEYKSVYALQNDLHYFFLLL